MREILLPAKLRMSRASFSSYCCLLLIKVIAQKFPDFFFFNSTFKRAHLWHEKESNHFKIDFSSKNRLPQEPGLQQMCFVPSVCLSAGEMAQIVLIYTLTNISHHPPQTPLFNKEPALSIHLMVNWINRCTRVPSFLLFAIGEVDVKKAVGGPLVLKQKFLLITAKSSSDLQYQLHTPDLNYQLTILGVFFSSCYVKSNKEILYVSLHQVKFPFNWFLVTFIMERYLFFRKYF